MSLAKASVKLSLHGTNGFNEPADIGSSLARRFDSGFTDDELKAGKFKY